LRVFRYLFQEIGMKKIMLLAALGGISASAFAAKDCEELKAEIATKLEAKGVQNYHLDIVAPAEVASRDEVGSCGGGSKRIVYTRDKPLRAAEQQEVVTTRSDDQARR